MDRLTPGQSVQAFQLANLNSSYSCEGIHSGIAQVFAERCRPLQSEPKRRGSLDHMASEWCVGVLGLSTLRQERRWGTPWKTQRRSATIRTKTRQLQDQPLSQTVGVILLRCKVCTSCPIYQVGESRLYGTRVLILTAVAEISPTLFCVRCLSSLEEPGYEATLCLLL